MKNLTALISTVYKIDASSHLHTVPERMSAFFIASPSFNESESWFSTHPSINDRVVSLVHYAGGTDEGKVYGQSKETTYGIKNKYFDIKA